jgi:hypothetical protein
MNSREVASLALKLLGVYAIIEALPLLQYLGALAAMPSSERASIVMRAWAYLAMFVPFALVAIAAFVLLTQSEGIARLLVKEDRTISPGGLSSRDVQTIAFSIVGALVFILAMPGVCQLIMNLWYLGPGYYGGPSPERSRQLFRIATSAAGPVIQCVLGIVLFFRSRGVANFWHGLQSARYVKIGEAEPPESTERKE